jgi:hypothetical protein
LLPFATYCAAPTSLSLVGEVDRTLAAADRPTVDEGRNDSGAESDALTTSSVTLAVFKMADNKVPEMSDYWKKSTITEVDHQAYHDFGWLTGNLMSTVLEVDLLPPTAPPWFVLNPILSLGFTSHPANS